MFKKMSVNPKSLNHCHQRENDLIDARNLQSIESEIADGGRQLNQRLLVQTKIKVAVLFIE